MNGKGSKPRSGYTSQYRSSHNQIDWGATAGAPVKTKGGKTTFVYGKNMKGNPLSVTSKGSIVKNEIKQILNRYIDAKALVVEGQSQGELVDVIAQEIADAAEAQIRKKVQQELMYKDI